jgi:hypothetical protein
LDEGVLPSVWKICSVTPVLKSTDSSFVANYRPISISPHITKIFESLLYNYLRPKLNHILILQQYGFRTGRSSVSCRVSFSSFIYDCLSNGAQVDVIFTNLSKAFDTVPNNLTCLLKSLTVLVLAILFFPYSVHICSTVNNSLN